MKSSAILLFALAITPALFGQKKEQILEMQRDINQLHDDIRSLSDKIAAMQAMLQQTLDAANKTNTSVAVLQSNLADRVGEQTKNLVGPVAGVGSKVDQMSEEFRSVRENVADMTSRLARVETKVNDLSTAVRTINAPPAAPPPSGAAGGTGAPTSGVPAMSAEQAYQTALTDYTKGNLDLALQEFTDYVKTFPNTDYAPNAQFYVGETYRRKGDLQNAIDAYNQVIDGYKDNSKTPDAFYMKGVTLVQAGKPTAAKKEFTELIRRYPNTDLASKAKSQLKSLGYSTAPPAKTAAHKRK
jgi:tol-pal system protein YbgF